LEVSELTLIEEAQKGPFSNLRNDVKAYNEQVEEKEKEDDDTMLKFDKIFEKVKQKQATKLTELQTKLKIEKAAEKTAGKKRKEEILILKKKFASDLSALKKRVFDDKLAIEKSALRTAFTRAIWDAKEPHKAAQQKLHEVQNEIRSARWTPRLLWLFNTPVKSALGRINWDSMAQDVKDCGPIDYEAEI